MKFSTAFVALAGVSSANAALRGVLPAHMKELLNDKFDAVPTCHDLYYAGCDPQDTSSCKVTNENGELHSCGLTCSDNGGTNVCRHLDEEKEEEEFANIKDIFNDKFAAVPTCHDLYYAGCDPQDTSSCKVTNENGELHSCGLTCSDNGGTNVCRHLDEEKEEEEFANIKDIFNDKFAAVPTCHDLYYAGCDPQDTSSCKVTNENGELHSCGLTCSDNGGTNVCRHLDEEKEEEEFANIKDIFNDKFAAVPTCHDLYYAGCDPQDTSSCKVTNENGELHSCGLTCSDNGGTNVCRHLDEEGVIAN